MKVMALACRNLRTRHHQGIVRDGGVMAQSINLATTAMNGDVVINYSNCALLQAGQQTGLPALSRSRSWTQLF